VTQIGRLSLALKSHDCTWTDENNKIPSRLLWSSAITRTKNLRSNQRDGIDKRGGLEVRKRKHQGLVALSRQTGSDIYHSRRRLSQ
jgi:hypothetical protein